MTVLVVLGAWIGADAVLLGGWVLAVERGRVGPAPMIPHRIIDLCDYDGVIRDRRLEGVVLMGPAVIAVIDAVTICHSALDLQGGTLDDHFVSVPEGAHLFGVVGLERVVIDHCALQGVSFIGTPEQISLFKAGFTGADTRPQTITPPPFYRMLDSTKELPRE